jgi:uncharacterized protein
MITIDRQIARRFVLGRQGLWPGRRWRGVTGTEEAMRALEYLQLDPLQMVARSQDITLHSRVLDYRPSMWETAAYGERKFFDWGGWLAVRPMEELPHWRVVMRWEKENEARLQEIARNHPETIREMREVLQARETVTNRDFERPARIRTASYRGGKDSALALYYLWRTGEAMTYRRESFERVYARTELVAPAHLIRENEEPEVRRFLITKEIGFSGLSRLARTSDSYRRGLGRGETYEALLADGEIAEVKVEGWKANHYALGDELVLLEDLSAGRVPRSWLPSGTTTTEETVFLSPLDPVCARGRAKILFDFDYVWEVYKPAHKRQFGYYALPILWGDRLAGRFDSKLDRSTNTYVILGIWLENEALEHDDAFTEAFSRGMARFVTFLGADKLDARAVSGPLAHRLAAAQGPRVDNRGCID